MDRLRTTEFRGKVIKGEETQRSEADKLFQGFVTKTEWAAWFIFLGTLLIALAEGVR